jgi:hypothetical protein
LILKVLEILAVVTRATTTWAAARLSIKPLVGDEVQGVETSLDRGGALLDVEVDIHIGEIEVVFWTTGNDSIVKNWAVSTSSSAWSLNLEQERSGMVDIVVIKDHSMPGRTEVLLGLCSWMLTTICLLFSWIFFTIRLIDSLLFNGGFDRLFWCRAKVEIELLSWLKKTVRGERLKGTVDRDCKAVATLFEMHPLGFDWGLSDFLTPGQKSENVLDSTEAMLDIVRGPVRKVSLIPKFDEFLAVPQLMIGREFIKDEWIPRNSDEKLASGANNIGNDNVPETSVVRILLPGLTTGLLSDEDDGEFISCKMGGFEALGEVLDDYRFFR